MYSHSRYCSMMEFTPHKLASAAGERNIFREPLDAEGKLGESRMNRNLLMPRDHPSSRLSKAAGISRKRQLLQELAGAGISRNRQQ